MHSYSNLDTRAGRQLDAMLNFGNRNARVVVTVTLTNGSEQRFHQSFRFKTWENRDGARMLTADLMDGDWAAEVHATKVLHANLTTGEQFPAKGMSDKLMLYACRTAFAYLLTGQVPTPGNGTVTVQEESFCGCCGRELTHPDSIAIGIGPECERRLGGDGARYGLTLTGKGRKDRARQERARTPRPSSQDTPGTPGEDIFGAPLEPVECVKGHRHHTHRAAMQCSAPLSTQHGSHPDELRVQEMEAHGLVNSAGDALAILKGE